MEIFVSKVLGLKELSPPALSLKNVLRETQSSEPVLIIISSGSDPSEELRELAQKTQQVNPKLNTTQNKSQFFENFRFSRFLLSYIFNQRNIKFSIKKYLPFFASDFKIQITMEEIERFSCKR